MPAGAACREIAEDMALGHGTGDRRGHGAGARHGAPRPALRADAGADQPAPPRALRVLAALPQGSCLSRSRVFSAPGHARPGGFPQEGETSVFDDANEIHRYTRADALREGVLIDVSETAREAGFRYPVALTR